MSELDKDWAEVKLTKGMVSIVDVDDLPRTLDFKWQAVKDKSGFRAYSTTSKKKHGARTHISLANVILGFKLGYQIDHINGDPLDNRKKNLRFCTTKENNRNRSYSRPDKTSIYKGVSRKTYKRMDGSFHIRWQVNIMVDRKDYYIGIFLTEIEAATAYDNVAKKHFGDFARLNFPIRESEGKL